MIMNCTCSACKQLKPEENFTTCLVMVGEVEQLHATFAERLRAALGPVPGRGFPRISRMRPGQTRFTLTDVAGNSVIYIKRGEEDEATAEEQQAPRPDPLAAALALAARLRDFKNDDAAAARARSTPRWPGTTSLRSTMPACCWRASSWPRR